MRSWRETSLGDKAAAASGPSGDFEDQRPSHWEVRTPIASSYLVKKNEKLELANQRKLGWLAVWTVGGQCDGTDNQTRKATAGMSLNAHLWSTFIRWAVLSGPLKLPSITWSFAPKPSCENWASGPSGCVDWLSSWISQIKYRVTWLKATKDHTNHIFHGHRFCNSA